MTDTTTYPRSPRTTITAVLIGLVTIPFVMSAVNLWQVAFGTLDQETTLRLIAIQFDPVEAGFFLQLAAVFMASMCVWAALLAVGVFVRREGARMASLVTFVGLGLITGMLAIGALTASERPEGWLLAVVVAAVNGSIVWLLWSAEVADDISRGAHARDRRRREARAARSAGRAGRTAQ